MGFGWHRVRGLEGLGRRCAYAGLAAAVFFAAGCQTETRVVKYHPMLGGLPNSESGLPIVRGDNYIDPTVVPEDKLTVVDPVSKKKTLTARTGRHLMVHIYNCVLENDKETFVAQVLSGETKAECAQRNVDPGACFDEVVRRKDDMVALFNAMPGGEFTPGVYVRNLGPKAERVQVEGLAAKDLSWTGFDMVMEKGNWKLRWFVGS
jgi:hypothetical protein